MLPTSLLALDIGGANIKIADGLGYAASWPFALWKDPEGLSTELRECLAAAPEALRIVVTMTGELADCFVSKSSGVRAIVDATLQAAPEKQVAFYQTDGTLVSAEVAKENPGGVAASNWHALGSMAARCCEQLPGILIDLGSTTTDFIPLIHGKTASSGFTDPERLLNGELVYSGVERTPICGLVSHLPWRGRMCPVAAELFATTADVYLLLGEIAEDLENLATADGRPLTPADSHNRLARMICADGEQVSPSESFGFAQVVREEQLKRLVAAFRQVVAAMPAEPQTIVLSGHGEFLAQNLLQRMEYSCNVVSLTREWGPLVSRCATAHALALLAREI